MMRTRRHAPVDAPFQRWKGVLDGIGREGGLSVDGEAGLAPKPAAQSARTAYPDVKVDDRCRLEQGVGLVELMGEGGEGSEVRANPEVEGAELNAQTVAGQPSRVPGDSGHRRSLRGKDFVQVLDETQFFEPLRGEGKVVGAQFSRRRRGRFRSAP